MTPEVLSFLREYGLPLTMLGLFAWAIHKRWFVTGAELERSEARYERERADRIAAQDSAKELAPANAEVAEAVAGLAKTVLERLPAPDLYEERLEGERRRGR